MSAYITHIQKPLIFISVNLTILGQVAKLNSVYIFILFVGYADYSTFFEKSLG